MNNNQIVLYIGNKLSHHGYTPGVIETLGKQLEKHFTIYYSGTKKNQIFRFFEMMTSILRYKNRISYILIDTYSTKAFWFAFFSGFLSYVLGLKYIPILHGGNLPWRLNYSKRACKFLFTNSFKNVAVSNYLYESFKLAGFDSIIIPNNIEISQYKYKERSEITPNLLWVRSFQKEYNPMMAIEILRFLLKEYPDSKLCMVGPDKDGSMEEIESFATELNIDTKVLITGRLSKTEWHKLSEDYDIFINTTNYDNTPVSVIEAAALGLPIISTNVGGIPYLLKDGEEALLIPPRNPVKFAEAIITLLKDPKLVEKLTKNARNKAENFDWFKVKESWIKLLK